LQPSLNAFGHLTATGISSAEDKNGLFIIHTWLSGSGGRLITDVNLLAEADFLGRGF
jgi:hypothetical protein